MKRSTLKAPSQLMKGSVCIATLLSLLFLLEYSAVAQECPASHPATPVIIHVPHEEYFIASLKSRLIRLLTDSLADTREPRPRGCCTRTPNPKTLMKQIMEESGYASLTVHTGREGDAQALALNSSLPTNVRNAPNSQTEMVTTTHPKAPRFLNRDPILTRMSSNGCLRHRSTSFRGQHTASSRKRDHKGEQ